MSKMNAALEKFRVVFGLGALGVFVGILLGLVFGMLIYLITYLIGGLEDAELMPIEVMAFLGMGFGAILGGIFGVSVANKK